MQLSLLPPVHAYYMRLINEYWVSYTSKIFLLRPTDVIFFFDRTLGARYYKYLAVIQEKRLRKREEEDIRQLSRNGLSVHTIYTSGL